MAVPGARHSSSDKIHNNRGRLLPVPENGLQGIHISQQELVVVV